VCPYLYGFQGLESRASKKEKIEGAGYCAAWSMFFTELALKNPTVSSDKLIDIVYNKVNGIKGSDYLRRIIRGYVNIISEKLEKYYEILFGEKTSVNNITNIFTNAKNDMRKYARFRDKFFILLSFEMELINNPSITKNDILQMIEEQIENEKGMNKPNINLITELMEKKEVLNKMDILKNPSPDSGEIFIISPKKVMSPNSKTKKIKSKSKSPKIPTSRMVTSSSEKKPIIQEIPLTPLESLSSVSSFDISPNCPEGKFFDQKKGRCVRIKNKTRKNSPKVVSPKVVSPKVVSPKVVSPKLVSPKVVSPKVQTKKIKSCPPGEEINPDTGRCKKIKVYPPCPERQQRDPITHRCRKIK